MLSDCVTEIIKLCGSHLKAFCLLFIKQRSLSEEVAALSLLERQSQWWQKEKKLRFCNLLNCGFVIIPECSYIRQKKDPFPVSNSLCTMNQRVISMAESIPNSPDLWVPPSTACCALPSFPLFLISIPIPWTWCSLSVVGLGDWIAQPSLPGGPLLHCSLGRGGDSWCCLFLLLSLKSTDTHSIWFCFSP